MIPFATTEHLILRPFRESDLPQNMALQNDLRVMRGLTGGYLVPAPDLPWSTYAQLLEKIFFAVVVEVKPEFLHTRGADPLEIEDPDEPSAQRRQRRQFVGGASLVRGETKNRDVTFSIALAFAWWGKGYGTEIMRWLMGYTFEVLGMHRLALNVHGDNERAVELYKYLGFVEEGRKREALWNDRKWVDRIQMAMLDKEWETSTAKLGGLTTDVHDAVLGSPRPFLKH